MIDWLWKTLVSIEKGAEGKDAGRGGGFGLDYVVYKCIFIKDRA